VFDALTAAVDCRVCLDALSCPQATLMCSVLYCAVLRCGTFRGRAKLEKALEGEVAAAADSSLPHVTLCCCVLLCFTTSG
jgi:hypothetical protein